MIFPRRKCSLSTPFRHLSFLQLQWKFALPIKLHCYEYLFVSSFLQAPSGTHIYNPMLKNDGKIDGSFYRSKQVILPYFYKLDQKWSIVVISDLELLVYHFPTLTEFITVYAVSFSITISTITLFFECLSSLVLCEF